MKPQATDKSQNSEKDERILVSILRELAQNPGREAEIIDRRARESPWASSWPEMYDHLPQFPDRLDFGSANIRSLASGCALWHPKTRDAALASWERGAHLESTQGFELEEPGSRIYRAWSLLGRLSAFRWASLDANREAGSGLRLYLDQWLALYWTVEILAAVELPDGVRSLRCGARSQGCFDRIKPDYALSLAMALPWSWRKTPPLPDAAWRKDDEILAFDALAKEIEVTAAPLRGFSALTGRAMVDALNSRVPAWPTIAPTVYRRTTEGLAVWCERSDVNSNTPGIAAMIWYKPDRFASAPTPSRAHVREKRVPQDIVRNGDRLHFQQLPPGTPEELDLDLPGGDLIYEVRHNGKGLQMVAP